MTLRNYISSLLLPLRRKRTPEPRGIVSERDLSYLDESGQKLTRLYARICRYMEEKKPYLNSSLCVGDVAAKLFHTKAQVSRAVNLCSGLPFRNFVNSYRIKYACGLLDRDPYMKIEEVAFMSGFNTLPPFNNAFKMFVHKCPSEFKSLSRKRAERR